MVINRNLLHIVALASFIALCIEASLPPQHGPPKPVDFKTPQKKTGLRVPDRQTSVRPPALGTRRTFYSKPLQQTGKMNVPGSAKFKKIKNNNRSMMKARLNKKTSRC